MIYNASAYEKEEDPLIRSFLHFIYTNEPGQDDFSRQIFKLVDEYKEKEEFRSDYLAMNLHDHDIRYEAHAEGLAEGARMKAVEGAIMLIQKYKATPETAAKDMNAPLELVLEALKKKA